MPRILETNPNPDFESSVLLLFGEFMSQALEVSSLPFPLNLDLSGCCFYAWGGTNTNVKAKAQPPAHH
jgi:hypothetical protein